MVKRILSDSARCVGCHTCELACSMHHFKTCNPRLSRIKVVEDPLRGIYVPIPDARMNRDPTTGVLLRCDLCGGEPQCVKWCPEQVLSLREVERG